MRNINDVLIKEMIAKEPMGRQIDAWVAEWVMEWEIKECEPAFVNRSPDGFKWRAPNYTMFMDGSEYGRNAEIFQPSYDIHAVWQVIEKLRVKYKISIQTEDFGAFDGYCCTIRVKGFDRSLVVTWAETAPLAFCRACLLLMLAEPSENSNKCLVDDENISTTNRYVRYSHKSDRLDAILKPFGFCVMAFDPGFLVGDTYNTTVNIPTWLADVIIELSKGENKNG